ncbi:CSN8/PSMD8/EIF3K family domain-containing protein [Ditylenchus destructor]|nr:CSN8/PSMD8/EIF3K family domain-containing protein [Ditylenchus destructor]
MSAIVDRCTRIAEDELSVSGGPTALEYAELLLFQLVQQKIVEAKYTYLRATAKFKDDALLKKIWSIGYHLSKCNFGEALRGCRGLHASGLLTEQTEPYVKELQNRVTAIQLSLIVNCYTSIDRENVAELLGMRGTDGQFVPETLGFVTSILEQCRWTVEENFVYPVRSTEFQKTMHSFVDEQFGPNPLIADTDVTLETNQLNRDALKMLESLVTSSDFFDSN